MSSAAGGRKLTSNGGDSTLYPRLDLTDKVPCYAEFGRNLLYRLVFLDIRAVDLAVPVRQGRFRQYVFDCRSDNGALPVGVELLRRIRTRIEERVRNATVYRHMVILATDLVLAVLHVDLVADHRGEV